MTEAERIEEKELAIKMANKALDVPNADPDDELRTISRQFLRAVEQQEQDYWHKAFRELSKSHVSQGNKIRGYEAENERLQQLIKTQNELLETANNSFNDIYKELKSAQELNRELVESIDELLSWSGFVESFPDAAIKLEALINKAHGT